MKRFIIFVALIAAAVSANAQQGAGAEVGKDVNLFSFTLNAYRFEAGLNFGQAGSFSDYKRFGMGANLLLNGVYLDFLAADPQHKYTNIITDTQWEDNVAFCINAGYQIPILSWLRIMPLVGYGQTNEGLTDGSSMYVESGDDSFNWVHKYTVTPGSRTHYFNYGGGLSIQPCKWFSINAIVTRCAIYGGIGIDALALAGYR